MAEWRMSGEPPLDELLDDEVMDPVMRKAGLDRSELRRRLTEIARRLAERRSGAASCGCGTHLG